MSGPLVVRRPRVVLTARGRDPVGMVQGLATADIAAVTDRRGAYTTFLTPKGRLVADARVFLEPGPDDAATGLLLDTHPDAAPGLFEHLRKYVPPLFARFTDVSADWAVLAVHGRGASVVAVAGAEAMRDGVSADALGPDTLPADAPEEAVPLRFTSPPALVVRSGEAGGEGWDLFVPSDSAERVLAAMEVAGGRRAGPEVLDRLRILAGRPAWGAELTGEVIPLEAGLLDRAISQDKGCYTGQEVIVRILHRGHVNRHLRRLQFMTGPAAPGTELFEPGNEKPRGVVTSAVEAEGQGAAAPRANGAGAVGLGYVRREIVPPAELRAGSPDGEPVRVLALH